MSEVQIGSGSGLPFRVRVVRISSQIRVRTFGHSDKCPNPKCWRQMLGSLGSWAMNNFGPRHNFGHLVSALALGLN